MTDDPRLLDFKAYERLGTPICDLEAYLKTGEFRRLDSKDDLPNSVHEGRVVLADFMGGWCRAVVRSCGDGWIVETNNNCGCVEWSDQDACWVIVGWFNKKALDKINFK